MTDNLDLYFDMLPEGGLPICGMRIVSYLNKQGTTCYRWDPVGEVQVAALLGIMEMVKAEILEVALNVGRAKFNEEDES